MEAVDAFEGADAEGEMCIQHSGNVLDSCHTLDVYDSKGKALCILKFKHEDFQIMKVHVQWDLISEVPHSLRTINGVHIDLHVSDYTWIVLIVIIKDGPSRDSSMRPFLFSVQGSGKVLILK